MGLPCAKLINIPRTLYISLHEASKRRECVLPTMQFSNEEDHLLWRWETHGKYSARSFYEIIMADGNEAWSFAEICSYKIPPSVKIFMYLLIQNRLFTCDVMIRRGFNCSTTCVMCDNSDETAMHLFLSVLFCVEYGQDWLFTWV